MSDEGPDIYGRVIARKTNLVRVLSVSQWSGGCRGAALQLFDLSRQIDALDNARDVIADDPVVAQLLLASAVTPVLHGDAAISATRQPPRAADQARPP